MTVGGRRGSLDHRWIDWGCYVVVTLGSQTSLSPNAPRLRVRAGRLRRADGY